MKQNIKFINFGLQFILWLLFGYTVVFYFIDWLPRFGISMSIAKIILYSTVYIICVSLLPYLNSYVLINIFYRTKKVFLYYFLFFFGIVLSLCLFVLVDFIFIYPEIPSWFFVPVHFLSRLPYVFIFTLAIYLFKIYGEFYVQKEQQIILQSEKFEAELLALKSQINPHFLFNTLNNIQSLSFTNPEKASETIVNLSNLFRYISYEGLRDKVNLGEEIQYISNYLALSVMKKVWLDKVSFNFNEVDNSLQIEPLLLINFIENAFKHGSLEDKNDYIKIEIQTNKNQIIFSCSNTFHDEKRPSGKIGLENVKKRLELVYPFKYELNTIISENLYEVNLIINHEN